MIVMFFIFYQKAFSTNFLLKSNRTFQCAGGGMIIRKSQITNCGDPCQSLLHFLCQKCEQDKEQKKNGAFEQ